MASGMLSDSFVGLFKKILDCAEICEVPAYPSHRMTSNGLSKISVIAKDKKRGGGGAMDFCWLN